MSIIHKSKDGRLHIYVRQDMYKGKLKSENWVGRTFVNKKQKVVSSGTKNLDEAKVILEKWYDEITPDQLDEIKWNLKEIQNTISNIENKIKK